MANHADLTGADLHEPKGAAAAASGTVYVSNGAGSGSWTSLAASKVTVADADGNFSGADVETVLTELNDKTLLLFGVFADVSNPSTILIPIGFSCTVLSIDFILGGEITVADSILTVTRSDGAAMGSQTITFSGSAEGTAFTFTPSGNAAFTYNTHRYVKIVSDGGSTTTQPLYVVVKIRRD